MQYILTFGLALFHLILFAQYEDPNFPIPTDGYGSEGPHEMSTESFPNPYFPEEDIMIFHPADIGTQVPTLFYSHAFGGNDPFHVIRLMNFLAGKGYAIVFVPYQTVGVSIEERYENLLQGFRKAARDYSAIIDTTRVGFLGHSFGGGAVFANAYRCFTENSWGENGRFIHSSAPWYSFNISQEDLTSFPEDTKLIVEVYEDDVVNDHRMGMDMFRTINIDPSEKDFIMVKSDTINDYIYSATHDLPTNYTSFDALDYYAYFRLIDALCDYTFNGSLAGKEVALGNGSELQISMPEGLNDLVQSDDPLTSIPQEVFGFPCNSIANPRNMYCEIVSDIEDLNIDKFHFNVFPNPTSSHLNWTSEKRFDSYIIYSAIGQKITTGNLNPASQIDVSCLTSGSYFVQFQNRSETIVRAFNKH